MGSHASLASALLLLLLWHSSEAAALTLTSNSTGNVQTGQIITLNIYPSQALTTAIITWTVNGTIAATWANGMLSSVNNRVSIIDNVSLVITNANKNDAGTYTVTVNVVGQTQASLSFHVKIYDPVINVSVVQSPESVSEGMALVNLTCSSAGDADTVTWTRSGQTLGYNDSYTLLNGNRTLQIKNPDRTYSGNYTCSMSNPISADRKTFELTVSYTNAAASLSGGAIAGIVIGSVLGAILLIALIVLVVYCIRKRKREEKKPQHKDVLRTVSGNTLSPDDPAYFTVNNIMYRNSSISMGSYIMNSGDYASSYYSPSPNPPSSPIKIKHATQV
ncbi:carcinoembryonic antigen-related cell adhesion molecule 1-like [Hyperolius riggenbachi]|uniref:carcinoembryonic antigen-related cell adhesion molecule 1-like n=1 Tax=Hyperolius riggenbachi TaxID=752182 RepID=UPI0035A375B6